MTRELEFLTALASVSEWYVDACIDSMRRELTPHVMDHYMGLLGEALRNREDAYAGLRRVEGRAR